MRFFCLYINSEKNSKIKKAARYSYKNKKKRKKYEKFKV